MPLDREVWITGLGLVSCIGEGVEAHRQALSAGAGHGVRVDDQRFAPYTVHPVAALDPGRQIPSKSDQKQMGAWQRMGVHAAGLALDDAGLSGKTDILDRMDLVVAAGNGERDESLDSRILTELAALPSHEAGRKLNEMLATGLRPTLYLGELSNLLAGNIQIVHKVTGSSRTLKGEEIAGLSAVENAVRRIAGGQADVVLAGAALNAEREDLLLAYELGANLWADPYRSVWQRSDAGGGFVPGTAAAFLVVEARPHAEARGASPYARISRIVSDRAPRTAPGQIEASLANLHQRLRMDTQNGPLAVLSGASGVEPATAEERAFLAGLRSGRFAPAVRAYGSLIGHAVEAHFPLGVAFASLAVDSGAFYPPLDHMELQLQHTSGAPLDQILVTCVGHWRGEGMAVVERVPRAEAGP